MQVCLDKCIGKKHLINKLSEPILKFLTRKSQLQRIFLTRLTKSNREVFLQIVDCLNSSKFENLKNTVYVHGDINAKDIVMNMMTENILRNEIMYKTKNVNLKDPFITFLEGIVNNILKYNNFKISVRNECIEEVRKYQPLNIQMLSDIWVALNPKEEVPRIPSKKWRIIGFSTNDPFMEFSSLGMFSLKCLHRFCIDTQIAGDVVGDYYKMCEEEIHIPLIIVFLNTVDIVKENLRTNAFHGHFASKDFSEINLSYIYGFTGRIFIIFCNFLSKNKSLDFAELNNLKTHFSNLIAVSVRNGELVEK